MLKKRIFLYYTLAVLMIPNVMLCVTEGLGAIASAANILLPGGVILLLLACSRSIGRNIWLAFPFFFFAAFQLVLMNLYGRSVIAVDMFLNLVTTNVSEVSELLGNMLTTLLVVFMLYLPPLIAGYIMCRHGISLDRRTLRWARISACASVIAGMILCITAGRIDRDFSVKRDIYPANVVYNVYLAFDRTARTSNYHETSAAFRYDAVPTHPADSAETYIMVIGETSRASDWQLCGYSRSTNPLLSRHDDIFVARNTYSESNTTHKSVPMLLSPVDAETFDRDIYTVKSIISAFKEAGFRCSFISNQRYNHSFIDFFAEEADMTLFLKETDMEFDPSVPEDLHMLVPLDRELAKPDRKKLIVLHTYGSHFNYRDRYTDEFARFLPDDYDDATSRCRDRLINAYDNTITVTDRLLHECISRLDSVDGMIGGILYTSDHGEDIFDDESGRFLHASPVPSIQQVHVPLLAWVSSAWRGLYPEKARALAENTGKFVSSSRSFAPTIADMAGLESGHIDTTASLVSPGYTPREALYLDDHNRAVPLRKIVR